MSARWPHANSLDWWDGPDRFKQINRCEVATIQNEALLCFLDAIVPGPKIDLGGPTPPHLPPEAAAGHTAGLKSFISVNIAPREFVTLVADACRRLPFEAGHFALVFSSHTIEHVYDVDGFLAEADRLLRPGGYLCLICPDRRYDPHDCSSEKLGERSYEEFTPDELRERVGRRLPAYEIVSFDTRKNNYDFEIFARKP